MSFSAREGKAGRRTTVFYGWWIVLAAVIGLCLGPAPIVQFSFGVFLKPLSEYFHVSRGTISIAITLSNLASAAGAPVSGRFVDRYGPRKVVLSSTAMFGASLLLTKIFAGHLWTLYFFYVLVGLVSAGATPVPYGNAIAHWFDTRRGLALGLMMFGLGVGAILMPSVANHLITTRGWAGAYFAFGAAVLVISVPVLYRFLIDSPDRLPSPGKPVVAVSNTEGLTWPAARQTKTFWLIVAAISLVSASVSGCTLHLPAMLTDSGYSTTEAALASSTVGFGLLVGRLTCGYFMDRFFAPRVAAAFFAGVAAGMFLLQSGPAPQTKYLGAFLIGLGLGAEVDVVAFLTSRYFGLKSYGEIFGYAFGAFVLAVASGALLMGSAFDAAGSYSLPLLGFSCLTLFGAVLITRLGPYRFEPVSSHDLDDNQEGHSAGI